MHDLPGRLSVALLRAFSVTPLRANHWLGRGVGNLLWRIGGRERDVAMANLAFCFPDRSQAWRETLAKGALRSMGEALFEAPRIWRMDADEMVNRLDNPESLEDIRSVFAEGRGLVIAAPHLGSWEYTGQVIASLVPMTNMFRPPKYPRLGGYIRNARQRNSARLVPADASGVRALSRALAQGECIGILPDQEPESGSGVFAPFFGRDAYTMTLLPRLVRKRRTPVLFVFNERLPKGRFRLHYRYADEAIYSSDPEQACSAMNAEVEALIRLRPDQYNWNYKRFLGQPDGRDIYKESL